MAIYALRLARRWYAILQKSANFNSELLLIFSVSEFPCCASALILSVALIDLVSRFIANSIKPNGPQNILTKFKINSHQLRIAFFPRLFICWLALIHRS